MVELARLRRGNVECTASVERKRVVVRFTPRPEHWRTSRPVAPNNATRRMIEVYNDIYLTNFTAFPGIIDDMANNYAGGQKDEKLPSS